MARRVSYTKDQARAAIAASRSYAEALRRLGMCDTGGAGKTLKKWTVVWGISTDHFDPYAASRERLVHTLTPLSEVLVRGSRYHRGKLKERLFESRLKARRCEQCGQGEEWRGRPMSLILDHVNRPNCAATLDTHCGRKLRLQPRRCLRCDGVFKPKYADRRYCSAWCGQRHDRAPSTGPRPHARKVERPPYRQLLEEVERMGYRTTGRKYGVSDNAVRKWIRAYERELSAAA